MVEANRSVFERRDVVRFYASQDHLQGGEDAVLRELEAELGALRMLDIGVGGGRTTVHFAPRVKSYVGIDYAPKMIEAARARFRDRGLALEVVDARALPYAPRAFDFVLFSHCGIDYVDDESRGRVLGEVARVLEPGGTFAFSTHNLQRIRSLLFGRPEEPRVRRALRGVRRWRLRRKNPPVAELERADHAMVNDGAFRYRALTYHIRPRAQIAQLEAAGFCDVRVLSAETGARLADEALARVDEPWLMYVCKRA